MIAAQLAIVFFGFGDLWLRQLSRVLRGAAVALADVIAEV